MSDEDFLSRWSRRKRAAREGAAPREQPPAPASPTVPAAPVQAGEPEAPPVLPDVESLTPESDFTPFMRSEVDPALKRQALKRLFQDARFNVMDRLDVYIDDYSQPDPLPEGWLEKMSQAAFLGHADPAKEPGPMPEAPPERAPPSVASNAAPAGGPSEGGEAAAKYVDDDKSGVDSLEEGRAPR